MQVHTWEMNIAALKSASDRNVQNMVTVPAAQQRKVAKIKILGSRGLGDVYKRQILDKQ